MIAISFSRMSVELRPCKPPCGISEPPPTRLEEGKPKALVCCCWQIAGEEFQGIELATGTGPLLSVVGPLPPPLLDRGFHAVSLLPPLPSNGFLSETVRQ